MSDEKVAWHKPNHNQREIEKRQGKKLTRDFGHPTTGALMIAVVEFIELHFGKVDNQQLRAAFPEFRVSKTQLNATMRRVGDYVSLWEQTSLEKAFQDPGKGKSKIYYYYFSYDGLGALTSGNARYLDALKRILTPNKNEFKQVAERLRAGKLDDHCAKMARELLPLAGRITDDLTMYIQVAESLGLLKQGQSAKPTEEDLGDVVPSDDIH